MDSGQFSIQMRAPSGTRIEKTENYVAQAEQAIRQEIPPADLQMLISNTGVLYDWPAAYTPNAGPMDTNLMVQLTDNHSVSSIEYVRRLRQVLHHRFPFLEFSFETGGLIRSAITFGLPAPINVQVEGNRLDVANGIAQEIVQMAAAVPGTADVRIAQRLDYPQLSLDIDRTKAAFLGLNAVEAVKNIVTSLNSSVNSGSTSATAITTSSAHSIRRTRSARSIRCSISRSRAPCSSARALRCRNFFGQGLTVLTTTPPRAPC